MADCFGIDFIELGWISGIGSLVSCKTGVSPPPDCFEDIGDILLIGIFSTNIGVAFSFLRMTVGARRDGKIILIDDIVRYTPDIIINVIFHAEGKPKNGIMRMNTPRKKVFLFCSNISEVIIHHEMKLQKFCKI